MAGLSLAMQRAPAQRACCKRAARTSRTPAGARVACLYKPSDPQQSPRGGGPIAPSPHHGDARVPLERASALALTAERAPALDLARPAGGARRGAEPRLRIAVDVDEVLGRFVYALNGFCKAEYGMAYDVADYWIYEFAKIWGCDQDRSNHIVHEFFKSDHFNDGIPVIPGAFGALQRLSSWADLVVVTSRQHVIQDATLEWIDRHYPGTFSEVYFGNHFALEGASRKKSEICASIGAHVLVDDNVGYALDCAGHGIDVLLFDWEDSYPWSKPPPGFSHPNIRVVRDWAEAEAALTAKAMTLTATGGALAQTSRL
ncbi:MAG: hypothetical protein J3K34DRAFT_527293 [Monoraphidium minutum]|nr:MAG: hypothetical protein J3K34DRAFT_527293 [Monoraphidium minutum]